MGKRYIITANHGKLVFAGISERPIVKSLGVGGGALGCPKGVPRFSDNKDELKVWETRIDVGRSLVDIVNAIHYKDIEGIQHIEIRIEDDDQ